MLASEDVEYAEAPETVYYVAHSGLIELLEYVAHMSSYGRLLNMSKLRDLLLTMAPGQEAQDCQFGRSESTLC